MKIRYFASILLCMHLTIFTTNSKLTENLEKFEKSDLVDMVIFSYNRPMQLYALLESIEKYITGTGVISIIYRADNDNFGNAYKKVENDFPKINFFKQGPNPHADFKSFVMKCAFETPNNYICFAVDDIIVKDYVDLRECTHWLKKTESYGFYFRLGKNITENYMGKRKTPVPPNKKVGENIYRWKFSDGLVPSWNFPNTNDMTIYKKSDIKQDLMDIERFQTTIFENTWAMKADHSKYGLCFEESKIVNISINIVEDFNPCPWQFTSEWNKKINLYNPKQLLEKFNENMKIDIRPFYKAYNRAPHIERELTFITRKNGPNNYKKPDKELPIVIIVKTSNKNNKWSKLNADSISMQDYSNYRVIYVDNHPPKKIKNMCEAINSCDDNEIIMIIDGKDWLAHANVLNSINRKYLDLDIWLTYGSYENLREEGTPSVKQCENISSFYTWLFKKIQINLLRHQNIFKPLHKMAKTKHVVIQEILYIHNQQS